MKRTLPLLILALALGCESSRRAALLPPMDQERADVYWLADDAREGRLPGTPGADESARYIADRFAALGLKRAPGLSDYRQPFETPGPRTIAGKTALAVAGDTLKLDQDFRPLGYSATGAFDGKAAFVGYGVANKAMGYDDYAGLNVKGRVVLAMRYEPQTADHKSAFTGVDWSAVAGLGTKANAAKAAGAVAMLVVTPPDHVSPDHAPPEPPLMPFTSQGYGGLSLPTMSITTQTAEKLLGTSLAVVQKQIDTSFKPQSTQLDVQVGGEVDLKTTTIHAANVVAVLPGTGPTKNEFIVVGAHYDHIGRGAFGSMKPGSGQIHNGADDNASGTAAVLSIAQRLSMQPLRRSVLFVTFSAEESGLIGSNYFVKHAPVPEGSIVAMLNVDMVGRVRNDTLFVGGGGTRAGFRKMLTHADQDSPLQLKSIGEGGFGPSDHMSFAMAKIPVVFFFSGMHPQYHHPDDDAPLINYVGMDEVCKLAIDVLRQIDAAGHESYVEKFDATDSFDNPHAASRPSSRPSTQSTTQTALQPGSGSARPGNASLGIVPDYGSDLSTGGIRIGGTRPGSAAEQGGLREGDILVGFNGEAINNLYDLSDFLRRANPSDIAEIAYTRGGQRAAVRVTLTARKGLQ